MTGRVTIRLPARRRGGRRGRVVGADVAPDAPGAATPPIPGRVPRAARVLALAHHWQALIRSGAVRDQADLARLVGLSRARVTQVMNLLWLAPEIQEAVLEGRTDGPGAERSLRIVAATPVWATQQKQWHRRRTHSIPPVNGLPDTLPNNNALNGARST